MEHATGASVKRLRQLVTAPSKPLIREAPSLLLLLLPLLLLMLPLMMVAANWNGA
jgi:hypothetical protein